MIKCRNHPNEKLIQIINYSGELFERYIEYDDSKYDYIRYNWNQYNENLSEGIYCAKCRELITSDKIIIEEDGLDETPDITIKSRVAEEQKPYETQSNQDFLTSQNFSIDKVWDDFHKKFAHSIVSYRDFPEKAEIKYENAESLGIRNELKKHIYGKILPEGAELYLHQGLAIESAFKGNNVVIETPTASGKSLCYTIPVFQSILEDPSATAIYISPLNALSEDQLENLCVFDDNQTNWAEKIQQDRIYKYYRNLKLGQNTIKIARFDSSSKEENQNDDTRRRIRACKPNILITNPEMLHWGILGWAWDKPNHWEYVIKNLKYIIIDEMHIYKGIFGANFANIIRRLKRLCHYAGSSPKFITCSATIKNPEELFKRLTGEKKNISIINRQINGSPSKQKRFVIIDSGKSNDALVTVSKNVVLFLLLDKKVKTITFMRSIASVDLVYRYLIENLQKRYNLTSDIIAHYKKELTPEKKAEITKDLRNGKKHGVVSTTALQLGIDIGDLSSAVISKYPGSIASVWQQAGRAGRKGESLIIMIADSDPLNQYFVNHPDDFFEMEPEEIFLDPDNKHIVLDHLWCATKDKELNIETDKLFFGDNIEAYIEDLKQKNKLSIDEARDVYVVNDAAGFPSKQVPIRAIGFELPVYDEYSKKILNPDSSRAARYFHKGARFQEEEKIYEVIKLDIDFEAKTGNAKAKIIQNPDYITSSYFEQENNIISNKSNRDCFSSCLSLGMIIFRSKVTGYYKLPINPDKNAKPTFVDLGTDTPPKREMETTSIWFTLPEEVYSQYDETKLKAGLHSFMKVLVMATCIEEFCDLSDVSGNESSKHEDTNLPTIFLHDTIPGGIGIAEKIYFNFEKTPELIPLFTESLDPKIIIAKLGMFTGKKIGFKDTLIFFDEIQISPRTITSLKYFCEEAPEYHIIAAGSLLGVSVGKKSSFPVGKVNFMNLYPMSFLEFLNALITPFFAYFRRHKCLFKAFIKNLYEKIKILRV